MGSLYTAGLGRFASLYLEGMTNLNIESFGTVNNKPPFLPSLLESASLHLVLSGEFALLPDTQLGSS